MIIGTAGHIDHGKTTLVRALTGVDTDRLPEEKKRGISIELGYAFLPVPGLDEPLGFIDVPGHERLVHTMLAGASGIDLALLLVAADDGPMPQTAEHLAVLSLLGLRHGAVVITKADRVEPDRLAAVQGQVAALLPGSALQDAPVFTVAAPSGLGIDPLRQWLFAQARQHEAWRCDGRAFRLAIDRAFTLDGVGTVVTGTVHAGAAQVGDGLQLLPQGPSARVRSLRAQNREVAQASAGQRCAVGLAGVPKEQVQRGQWLVGEGAVAQGDRLDVWLTLWQGEARPLRSGTPVHVHLGSASVTGTVAILEAEDLLAPGASGRAQLVLRQPVGAWHGDRVVLRDASASRTLAGGRVLDPFAPARYRRTPERLAELDAQALPSAEQRLAALLAVAAQGIDLSRWARAEGLRPGAGPALPPESLLSEDSTWALSAPRAAVLDAALHDALRAFHARAPEELGPDAARLRRLAAPRLPEPLWRALLARALRDQRVCQRGAFVHLPEHGVRLSATEERIGQKVAAALTQAGYEGAWVRDLARDHAEPEPLMRVTLARMAQQGALHQVVKDLFYPAETLAKAAALARGIAAAQGTQGEVTAARFRDATGLGRKRAIQILEYFDRIGLLRRVGDTHRLRADSTLFL
jgi:selenocysteine-specific elongation factor